MDHLDGLDLQEGSIAPTLPIGTEVEVRSSLNSWAAGFAVADTAAGRYYVRRISDGEILPHWFARAALRPIT